MWPCIGIELNYVFQQEEFMSLEHINVLLKGNNKLFPIDYMHDMSNEILFELYACLCLPISIVGVWLK